jgi:hypothetical protein
MLEKEVIRMNKKEIAQLRKEFKDDSINLKLKDLYSAYIKKDDTSPIIKKLHCFESMDMEKKELYHNNFKKILSSAIDTKLFELEFENTAEEFNSQKLLFDSVNTADRLNFQNNLDRLLEKLILNFTYDTDIVVNFVTGEYYKGNKSRNVEADESIDGAVQSFEFILCSVNKIDFPKKALVFDYHSREFLPNSSIEAIVNLNSPLDGFMFPAFENGYSNVNKVMYYCSKAKELNISFIQNVLNCTTKLTAEDEKECFHDILASVMGNRVKPELIQNIYEKMSEKADGDDELQTVGITDIKKILLETGINAVEQLEAAFEQTCGTSYGFKVDNIVPDFQSKSIRISNDVADISITPKNLGAVRQIIDKSGRKCILIEVSEDVVINGLTIETEAELQ